MRDGRWIWLRLAWRNLWRQKRRTAIQLAVVAGSVLIALWYNNLARGMYAAMIRDGVRSGSGHIGIYHPNYLSDRLVRQTVAPDGLIDELRKLDHVVAVMPRVMLPGVARSSYELLPVAIVGADLDTEQAINPILDAKRLVAGRLPSPGKRTVQAVVGARFAERLHLRVGSKFVFNAQNADGELIATAMRVAGIVRTGLQEIDEGTLLVWRQDAAKLLGRPGHAHEIAVLLDRPNSIAELLPEVQARAAARGAKAFRWEEAMPGLASGIRMDYAFLQAIVFVIFVLVAIGTVNILVMAVLERIREFGILRALGMERRQIGWLVLNEAVLVSLLGVAIGALLGFAATWYTWKYGIDLSEMMGGGSVEMEGVLVEPIMRATWDWAGMARLTGVLLLLSIAAALYPLRLVLRVGPADAVRHY
ncbi:MAG: ABC transporter permease [Candidatus Dadabacteria bacterium]|nr:MAG: ABC transporter permease [Candidatus Dadabacteria bacterium]